MINFCRMSIFILLAIISPLCAEQQQIALKSDDIRKIMQQILKQHVDQKEVNAKIVNESFKNYIDNFDPNRIYLLDEEVNPYLHLSNEDVQKVLDEYRNNEFPLYFKLNETIQKAIERARRYRKTLFQIQQAQLFTAKANPNLPQNWQDADEYQLFAKSEAELQTRIKDDIILFLESEKQRFGDADVMKNKPQTLALYENHMRHVEDPYMPNDSQGGTRSKPEVDNLFAIHILKALVSTLDSHTEFMDPQEAYDMKVRLQKGFFGVGVELENRPEGVVISGIILGSPAEKDGKIKAKDLLIALDERDVTKDSYEKVIDLLRGPKDSEVLITVKRPIHDDDYANGQIIKVKLKREEIAVTEGRVDVATEKFGNGIIGVIALHTFYQGSNDISSFDDVRDAIAKLNKEGKLRGLILDLRDNTGGFLLQAVKVAGLFISSGVIVISKYFSGEEHFFRDVDDTASYQGPFVILTSKETASAAEIVAQALQDYGVALIVGDERTFGKGTIQSQTVTDNGGTPFFKVTVGKYYTVSGKTPQLQGVKADILAPSKFANEPIGEEYLEHTIMPDTVNPAFADKLDDVDPSLKSWYLRYYTPALQHKVTMWQQMVPTLKKNSEYRISHNKNYQAFLKKEPPVDDKNENLFIVDEKSSQNFGHADVQLNEAINVVKDMITLQSSYHGLEGREALQQQAK
jgi:carboxyl-terminal processing protease